MGFGLLLIGYFLAFVTSLAGVYFFVDILGGALIVYALMKLSAYSEKFAKTVPSAIIFTVISAVAALIGTINADGIVLTLVTTARTASILLLHLYMFTAIEDMARGADDLRLAGKARRNLVIVSVYYVLFIIVSLGDPLFDQMLKSYFTVIMYFYGVICLVLNMFLIHSAYARLYIEGTEDRYAETAKFKKSRFKLINAIHDKYAASQKKAYEENYQLMKQSKDYVAANRDKIPGKKKKKKKK